MTSGGDWWRLPFADLAKENLLRPSAAGLDGDLDAEVAVGRGRGRDAQVGEVLRPAAIGVVGAAHHAVDQADAGGQEYLSRAIAIPRFRFPVPAIHP